MNAPSRLLSRFGRSRLASATALAVAVIAAGSLAGPTHPRSQAAPPPTVAGINPEALNAMLSQLSRQQEQMAANQTKIETQVVAVKEELRKLKIYSSRTGAARR